MPFQAKVEAQSSSGIAVADISGWEPGLKPSQLTIKDVTTGTGTASLFGMAGGADAFEPLKDANGDAVTVALSGVSTTITYTLEAIYNHIKVASDASGDSFTIVVGA